MIHFQFIIFPYFFNLLNDLIIYIFLFVNHILLFMVLYLHVIIFIHVNVQHLIMITQQFFLNYLLKKIDFVF